MGELTSSVLVMAMQQLATWNQQGLPTRIAVNISAENLTDLEFPQKTASTFTAVQNRTIAVVIGNNRNCGHE